MSKYLPEISIKHDTPCFVISHFFPPFCIFMLTQPPEQSRNRQRHQKDEDSKYITVFRTWYK